MKQRLFFLIVLAVSLPFGLVQASAIDSTEKWAWGEAIGWINWNTSNNTQPVVVSESRITGHIWSQQFGWINLHPTQAGVTNTCEGDVGGYAWGSSIGWIDMDNVSINPKTGIFSGTASTDDLGLIRFTGTNIGVTTDWRCKATTGSSSGGGSAKKVCRDKTALNYSSFGKSTPALCKYEAVAFPEESEPQKEQNLRATEDKIITLTPVEETEQVYFRKNISAITSGNDSKEVNKVLEFLNKYEGETLEIDGSYDSPDVEAVKRFQEKYKRSVLSIWGLEEPTGFVGISTRLKMNFIVNNITMSCPVFTEINSFITNNESTEIARAKKTLTLAGFYSGETGTEFTQELSEALISFQETFAVTILEPWGLARGTGVKGETTNAFLDFLHECDINRTISNETVVSY